LSTDKFLFKLL